MFFTWLAVSVSWLCVLLSRPFGQCYEFLTLHTVKKYFLPVIEMVPQFLENLTDEELKKEAKNEAKNDALSMIIKSLKNLASRVPGQEETVKNLEIFRLKMILRWVRWCLYENFIARSEFSSLLFMPWPNSCFLSPGYCKFHLLMAKWMH